MLTVGYKLPNSNLTASSDLPFDKLNMDNAIRFVMATDLNVVRNQEEALRALQTEELHQFWWIKGQKTIDLKNADV